MLAVFHPHTIPLMAHSCLDLSQTLLEIKETEFEVPLADVTLILKAKWLMVNIFLWRPLVKRGLAVQQRHTLYEGLVSKKTIARVMTEIYKDVVDHVKAQHAGVLPETEDHSILYDLCEIHEDMHQMVATKLGAYHLSISAFELCDMLEDPEFNTLLDTEFETIRDASIQTIEHELALAGKAMIKKLGDKTIPSNIIAPFLELGLLSTNQLQHVTVALGFRTDASETMIRYPILTSYIKGLQNIKDFAVESLSAKKTVYYNKDAMPDAQYRNRMQQILASVMRFLYTGDCGTPLSVPFYVTEKNAKNLEEKYIVEDGHLIVLDKKTLPRYINKTVHLRSPLVCRHTDGMCQICGGRMTDYIFRHSVIGIESAVEYMSPASQLVLSAKHFSKISAIQYTIPEILRDLLIIKQNDLYISPDIPAAHLKIGVSFRDMPHIGDLLAPDDDAAEECDVETISERDFSTINTITVARSSDETIICHDVVMLSDNTVPYFSVEFLSYMKDNRRLVSVGDVIWIDLKYFDHVNAPLLRYTIESNSMIKFNNLLFGFVKSAVSNYTSIPDALRDFTALVYREIDATNIIHLEVVLKSYLITDALNYKIPQVTDINAVQFGDIFSITPRRSLGQQYAFERLADFLKLPETYNHPHGEGVFDTFFYPK